MASVTELRNGRVFNYQNELYQTLSYEHIKMGRGGAVIKIKARNLKTGSSRELSDQIRHLGLHYPALVVA